jgi:hypothetical protein
MAGDYDWCRMKGHLKKQARDANYILKEKDSVSPLTRAPRVAWCELVVGVRRHECAGWWVGKKDVGVVSA